MFKIKEETKTIKAGIKRFFSFTSNVTLKGKNFKISFARPPLLASD